MLTLDSEKYTAKYRGKSVLFSPMEFDILKVLLNTDNDTVSRQKLVSKIWGKHIRGMDYRIIDKHISRIRRKTCRDVILTVPGSGYRYNR